MRAGVSLTTLRRLAKVELTQVQQAPAGEFPPLLSLDAWEAEAIATQEALLLFTRDTEGFDKSNKAQHSPFEDVSHKYKPGARMDGITLRS